VALLVAAVAGMVGFEAPLVYAAEAKDPRRTVSRAIAFTLLVEAFLYGGTAWVMSVVAGPDQIVAIAGDHLDDLFFFLPDPYLPTVIIDLGRIFFATSLFAAMLAFHHTVARYALTVAREGVLRPSLARTRDGVPVNASFAQSSIALAVLLLFGLIGWNPTTDLFFFGTVSGGLGVLVLMVIASIAVVRYFRRDGRGESRWRRATAPWISAVFLILILLLTTASFGILLDSDNLLKVWSPPLAFLLLFLAGVRWGRKLRLFRPDVYAVIGTGQAPAEAPPVPAREEAAATPSAPGPLHARPDRDNQKTAEPGPAPTEATAPPASANRPDPAPSEESPASSAPEKSPASRAPVESPASGAPVDLPASSASAESLSPDAPAGSPGAAAPDQSAAPDPSASPERSTTPASSVNGAVPRGNSPARRVPRARRAPEETGSAAPPATTAGNAPETTDGERPED
jgi:hypothetical protein